MTWNQVGQTGTDVVAFSDTTVLPASSYLYQVYAFNANGNSAPSNSVPVTTPDVAPAAPTSLYAAVVATTHVDLAWTDNATNETGFVVERSDDGGGTWNQAGQTGANVPVFTDATVLPASSYMYRVYAFNLVGNSANSNELTVLTPSGIPPAAPSNLLISNQTRSSLTLTWTDNSNNEDGFTLQIATDKWFTRNLQTITVGANVTTYTFSPLAPNTRYYMRVAAYNAAGLSAWSPSVNNKTLR